MWSAQENALVQPYRRKPSDRREYLVPKVEASKKLLKSNAEQRFSRAAGPIMSRMHHLLWISAKIQLVCVEKLARESFDSVMQDSSIGNRNRAARTNRMVGILLLVRDARRTGNSRAQQQQIIVQN